MKTLIFIHGGESFSEGEDYLDWIAHTYPEWMLDPWAPKEEKLDWKMRISEMSVARWDIVYMPQFPNKLNAKYKEWKLFFDAWIEKIVLSDEVILIGTSLGGCFLLKYFSEQNPQSPRASSPTLFQKELTLHLIAACIEAGDFTPPEHYDFLKNLGNAVHIWHAEDDRVVPFSIAKILEKELRHAQTHFFTPEKNYGHFHGVESLPDLEAAVFEK